MLFTYTAMVALFATPKDGTLLDVMIKLGETMLFTYTAMVALFTTPKDGKVLNSNLLQQHWEHIIQTSKVMQSHKQKQKVSKLYYVNLYYTMCGASLCNFNINAK